jgi:hypothetical protein
MSDVSKKNGIGFCSGMQVMPPFLATAIPLSLPLEAKQMTRERIERGYATYATSWPLMQQIAPPPVLCGVHVIQIKISQSSTQHKD